MMGITKIESARRHVDTAIKLHFLGYDPIVVHTIGSAAFRVLRDLTEIKDNSSFIYGNISDKTKRKMFEIFNQDFNFFKHADRDPDGILKDFDATINDQLLALCCFHYEGLQYEPTIYMKLFVYWVALIDEKCPVINKDQINLKSKLKLFNKSRSEQLKIGVDFIQKADNQNRYL